MSARMLDTVARLTQGTTHDAAAALLGHFNGSHRDAEREAWRLWEFAAGGTYFNRPRAEDSEALFLRETIRVLAFPKSDSDLAA